MTASTEADNAMKSIKTRGAAAATILLAGVGNSVDFVIKYKAAMGPITKVTAV